MSEPSKIKWKTAWVIGASSGIGYELAKQLEPMCEAVCVSARSVEKLQNLSSKSEVIKSYPLDVTDSKIVAQTFSDISNSVGVPDLIVISSGLWNQTEIPDFTPEIFRSGMEVNFMGVINVLDACSAVMIERGSGHIGVVSSVSGYRGLPNAAAYSPSKAALINLCESIAPQFLQKGVSVSIINPGFVDTPMTASNEFPMPFIISAEEAAKRIISGLEKKKFEIAFPRKLAWSLKFLKIIPNGLFLWVIKKFVLKA